MMKQQDAIPFLTASGELRELSHEEIDRFLPLLSTVEREARELDREAMEMLRDGLLNDLRGDDEQCRAEAIEEIEDFAVPNDLVLAQMLTTMLHPSVIAENRARAARALPRIVGPQPPAERLGEALVSALGDESSIVRREAARSAGLLPMPPRELPGLVAALIHALTTDPAEPVRMASLSALLSETRKLEVSAAIRQVAWQKAFPRLQADAQELLPSLPRESWFQWLVEQRASAVRAPAMPRATAGAFSAAGPPTTALGEEVSRGELGEFGECQWRLYQVGEALWELVVSFNDLDPNGRIVGLSLSTDLHLWIPLIVSDWDEAVAAGSVRFSRGKEEASPPDPVEFRILEPGGLDPRDRDPSLARALFSAAREAAANPSPGFQGAWRRFWSEPPVREYLAAVRDGVKSDAVQAEAVDLLERFG